MNSTPELRVFEKLPWTENPALNAYLDELTDAFVVTIVNFLYLTSPQVLFFAGRTITQFPFLLDRILERISQEYDRTLAKDLLCMQSDLNDDLLSPGSSLLVFNNDIHYFG